MWLGTYEKIRERFKNTFLYMSLCFVCIRSFHMYGLLWGQEQVSWKYIVIRYAESSLLFSLD